MKVAELEGEALDYWVARALGYASRDDVPSTLTGEWSSTGFKNDWHPSNDWSQGGPIIEREKIAFWPNANGEPAAARKISPDDSGKVFLQSGSTPLIAVMRCYIASKFGDEVDDAQPESAG